MNKHVISFALLLLFSLLVTSVSIAKDEVFIDDKNMQRYNGRIGLWIQVKSDASISQMVSIAGVSEELVAEINHGVSGKEYVFVPYSNDYIKELAKNGITGKKVDSKDTEFVWPLENIGRISSPFGYRNRRLHEGIDVPAPRGHILVSAMDGVVVTSIYTSGHGNTVLIEHKNNFATRYSHNSVNFVKTGDVVKKGQIIALAGSTGNSTGPHLHFELRFKDIPLNPLDFLPQDDDVVVTKHLK